VKFPHVY